MIVNIRCSFEKWVLPGNAYKSQAFNSGNLPDTQNQGGLVSSDKNDNWSSAHMAGVAPANWK
jgi:hypothetical protein